jgi:hypothetical protein
LLFVVLPLVVIFHAITALAGPLGVLVAVLVVGLTLYVTRRLSGDA